MKNQSPSPQQRAFDDHYITSSEIAETLGVSRSTVHVARVNGKLPNPIDVQGQIYIWERATIRGYLDAWGTMLRAQRTAKQA